MLKKLFQKFREPYPNDDPAKNKLLIALGFGLFIGLFLVFFKPYDLKELHHAHKNLFIFGFGAVTTISVLLTYFVLPPVFPKVFDPEKRTVGKEILLNYIFNIFLISILNIIYSIVFCEDCQPFFYDYFTVFIFSFLTVLATGLIPITILVLISQNIRMKRNIRNAESLTQKLHKQDFGEKKISFSSSGVNKILTVRLNRLIVVKAFGNYITVYFSENNETKKELIRNNLKTLEQEILPQYPELERCHKSYIVNISKIQKVTGNAQGYKLEFPELDFAVPVSRSLSKNFIQKIAGS